MRKGGFIFGFMLLCAWLFNYSIAQDSHKSIAWEIIHPKTSTKSYLIATIHTNERDVFNFSKEIIELVDTAKTFCFETDFANFQVQADFFKSYKDFDRNNIRNFNQVISGSEYGYPHFMDYHFYELGINAHKKIRFFESNLEQDSVINLLNGFYNDLSDIQYLLNEQYINRDMDSIYRLTYKIYRNNPELYHKIFTARNKEMFKKLVDSKTPTVYFVGAGHFGGDFGLLELLKAAKFKVRPILNTKCDLSSECFNKYLISRSYQFSDSVNRFAIGFSSQPELLVEGAKRLYKYQDLAQENSYFVRVHDSILLESANFYFIKKRASKEFLKYNNFVISFDPSAGYCYKVIKYANNKTYELFVTGSYLFMNSNRPAKFFDSFQVFE